MEVARSSCLWVCVSTDATTGEEKRIEFSKSPRIDPSENCTHPALPTETMIAVAIPFFSDPPQLLAPKLTTSGMRGYPPAAARKRPVY